MEEGLAMVAEEEEERRRSDIWACIWCLLCSDDVSGDGRTNFQYIEHTTETYIPKNRLDPNDVLVRRIKRKETSRNAKISAKIG